MTNSRPSDPRLGWLDRLAAMVRGMGARLRPSKPEPVLVPVPVRAGR